MIIRVIGCKSLDKRLLLRRVRRKSKLVSADNYLNRLKPAHYERAFLLFLSAGSSQSKL